MYTQDIKDFHKCWSGSLAKRRLCLGPAGVINCTPLSALSFWVSLFPRMRGYNMRTLWTVWKGKKIGHWKMELPRSVGAQYVTGDQWRNNFRKNEETEPKQKQHPAVDVTDDGSKVRCSKEQYCIGTWNVRSMNQGKLEVVKWEMARVNIDILGICKWKWTGVGEFNSDDHYIYYCGQESLRRNGVAIKPTKESEMQYLDAISKTTEWSLFISKANHSIPQ